MEMQPGDHLVAAALEGDASKVAEVLRRDPDLRTYRTMFGVGALHAAHFAGHADIAASLRPEKVDVFLAAELGDIASIDALLRSDPDMAKQFNASGSTALHGACYWGQLAATERLLDAHADASVPTRDSFLQISSLGSAIATTPGVPQPSDDPDTVLALVRVLLEAGADVNVARLDGMTPLHAAAWRGLSAVAQELVDAGADLTATATSGPHSGESPADTAVSQGHLVLAARLDTGTVEVHSPYG